ncbi:hypothetical protein [Falsiroseomonas sp.]|uniref:hypothetical protein n=1 Tax=Falsiroseomonas sp. TaxID=2870721 RepID=UPI002718BCF3|nr:hypothetical protein [Falsiroseomonas sp.]MDO9501378.1 hypothetical protein [Falsiroseomonas sp.]
MTRFARIADGRVAEIIKADGVPLAERYHPDLVAAMVPAPEAVEVGWRYDGGAFAQPVADDLPLAPAIRRITALAFRRRLPSERRAAITLAAAAALAAGDATIQVWLDDLSASQVVDLDDAELLAGVAALLDVGLISAAERDVLLRDGSAAEAA